MKKNLISNKLWINIQETLLTKIVQLYTSKEFDSGNFCELDFQLNLLLSFGQTHCFTITSIINISTFYIKPTSIAIKTEISMFNIETRIFALFYVAIN